MPAIDKIQFSTQLERRSVSLPQRQIKQSHLKGAVIISHDEPQAPPCYPSLEVRGFVLVDDAVLPGYATRCDHICDGDLREERQGKRSCVRGAKGAAKPIHIHTPHNNFKKLLEPHEEHSTKYVRTCIVHMLQDSRFVHAKTGYTKPTLNWS